MDGSEINATSNTMFLFIWEIDFFVVLCMW